MTRSRPFRRALLLPSGQSGVATVSETKACWRSVVGYLNVTRESLRLPWEPIPCERLSSHRTAFTTLGCDANTEGLRSVKLANSAH